MWLKLLNLKMSTGKVADPENGAKGRQRGPVGCAPSWGAGGKAPQKLEY